MLILSRLHQNDFNIPKDTTKAKIIKYLNDKTAVFNNQIITGFCSSEHMVLNTIRLCNCKFEVQLGTVGGKLMLFNIIEKKAR